MPDQRHIAQQGDCIHSLAAMHGHIWQTLWEHPENRHLREIGRTPSQLLPGDEVVIPEVRIKDMDAQTEQTHRYRKKGSLVELRVLVTEFGLPRKNEPCHLEIGSPANRIESATGKTNADGLAVFQLSPNLTRATLVVGTEKDRYELLIGHMDPPDTLSGKHARLENLGYSCGDLDTWDGDSDDAMNEFHREEQHSEPADRDSSTDHQRLKDAYGS
jgi:N-acetylmuramoyl-L-alanine amidase